MKFLIVSKFFKTVSRTQFEFERGMNFEIRKSKIIKLWTSGAKKFARIEKFVQMQNNSSDAFKNVTE